MKKLLIGGLVGGLILFIWQFLSWAVLEIHRPQMDYHPNQEAVMDVLTANLTEGEYFMPNHPNDISREDAEAFMANQEGKPWVLIKYHQEMKFNMGTNVLRAFLIDFLSVLFLVWILLKIRPLDFTNVLMSCLAVGLISYFTISYLNTIWFESNSIPDLIDAVVSWGFVGLWLGWYLPRGVSDMASA